MCRQPTAYIFVLDWSRGAPSIKDNHYEEFKTKTLAVYILKNFGNLLCSTEESYTRFK